MKFYNGVLLLLFMAPSVLHAENGSYSISSNWSTKFNAYVTVNVQTPVVNGWTIVVNFDKPVQALEIWNADVSSSFDNKKTYVLSNKKWNKHLAAGTKLKLNFNGVKMHLNEAPAQTTNIIFERI